MATVSYTIISESVNTKVIKWGPLTTTNADGAPYILSGRYPDKNFQMIGTLGTGGKIAMQGSNEATVTTWAALHDQAGAACELAALGVKQILENTLQIRPYLSAGDGTTSLYAYLIIRK